jgi:hypothetical protein
LNGVKAAVLILASVLSWSCGELGKVDQGRVVAFHEKVANPPGNLANAGFRAERMPLSWASVFCPR